MNTDDLNFAYRVRHALNETLDDLPSSTTDRLASARQLALSRKKAHVPVALAQSATATVGNTLTGKLASLFGRPGLLARMSLAIPVLVMGIGMVSIYQAQEEEHVAELAELDAAVLADELPLSAYLDHGFNAYLTTREQ